MDFYQRWNLSQAEQRSSKETRKLQSKQTSNQQSPSQSTSTITSKSSPKSQLSNSKLSPTSTLDSLSLFASSSQPGSSNWSNDPTSTTDQKEPLQLSPFHHLVILLTKFACTNFPHLLPRVLFAEETIGAFFDWRTGGGAKPLVHTLLGKEIPVEEDASEQYGMEDESESKKVSGGKLPLKTVPSFRAQWIGNDAMLSTEMRAASRSAQHGQFQNWVVPVRCSSCESDNHFSLISTHSLVSFSHYDLLPSRRRIQLGICCLLRRSFTQNLGQDQLSGEGAGSKSL